MDPSLLPFFSPSGVVIIGASHDPSKLGHGVARNMVASGYRGAIHLVNPRGGRLFDRPVYAEVALVPDPADLAILIVPAPAVPEALRACASRGIRTAIVTSGGFREAGPEGEALEAECVRIARESGVRLLGPNCIGVLDTHLPLDTTFLQPPGPLPGSVAFISHSGAMCAVVAEQARALGLGISRMVSLGNQADVTETELLPLVAEDPDTRVVTLFLEGVADGRRFVEESRRIARRKPIIALKAGRSTGGQRAAASHTGALAGQEAAYAAAFHRAGVMRAGTIEEMLEWARALEWCPLPTGRSMAVLTNAGGPGVMAADALEACGLPLAELNQATRSALQGLLPASASVRNPVDILASASPEMYAACLRLVLSDPGVHGVLVMLPPPPMHPAGSVAEALVGVVQASAKPVMVVLMGGDSMRYAAEGLRAARIPDCRSPESAASALAALAGRAEALGRSEQPPAVFGNVRPEVVREVIREVIRDSMADGTDTGTASATGAAGIWLAPDDAGRVLAAYGVPVRRIELARSAAEAAALACQMGFPVALKVASPQITHKSDVGGVILDLADAAGVASGFTTMLARVRSARPEAKIEGAFVQRMLPPGQDVIVGALADPQFGPLMMFGSGGVEVEGLRDTAFALAPLSRPDADALVASTWAGRRLCGYRSLPPADRGAVIEVVLRLAQLATDFPDFVEIEINPLRALPDGQGVVAVDVRILAAPSSGRDSGRDDAITPL
ncbi:MAG: acetate--CoA ligase family protein [bacterium]|nr:acetate--CoA ligase family protein [bacterium]